MTHTRGNVIVENIKIGDIHYEFGRSLGSKVEVIELPVRDDEGYWSWKSKNLNTGKEVTYGVAENLAHYGPNLYDYIAHEVNYWL
jgi:hypothetical protein